MGNENWGAIPRSLATDVSSIIGKRLYTSSGYKPVEWKDNIAKLTAMVNKTASGSVASFTDGVDEVACKSVECSIVASGGGGTPSTPVPIVGKSSVTVYHGKKNVFDITTYPITKKRYIRASDGYFAISTIDLRGATEDYIPCVSMRGKTWVINKPNQSSNTMGLAFYDENKAFLSSVLTYPSGTNGVFTVPNNAYYFRFTVDLDSADDTEVQIEAGTTATAFSPFFAPVSVTIQLGQTVYGGTLAEDGTLTITHWCDIWDENQNYNVSDNLTNVFRFYKSYEKATNAPTTVKCLCAIGNFSRTQWATDSISFSSDSNNLTLKLSKSEVTDITEAKAWLAQNNVYFIYELATPIVITGLDEISINTYLGDNNIWCDSGNTEVVYYTTGANVGSKSITANGTYNASTDGYEGYSTVAVNVQPNLGTKTISENGTYTASSDNKDGYSSVTVEVPDVPASLQTDMDAVLNKKMGSTGSHLYSEWAADVNLMGMLPVRTASGAIASFSDGADDVPLKNCIATVDANLSGVSSVIIRKNQKNFFDKSNSNLQEYYIDTNGVFRASSSYSRSIVIFLQKGTYTITRTIPQGSSDNRFRIAFYDDVPVTGSSGNILFNSNEALTATVTIASCGYLAIFLCNSQTYLDNIQTVLNSFQIELGSFSSTFEAYHGETKTVSLGRTIYGGSVDVVNGTAEPTNITDVPSNLTSGTSGGFTFSASSDGAISYSGTAVGTFAYITAEFDFAIKSGQTFTFSRNTAFSYIHRIRLTFSDDTTTNVSISANDTSVTYTTAKAIKKVRFLVAGLTADTSYNDTVYLQLQYGSTATAYSPYFTPFTFTPTPINSFLGDNNIWCDSGDSEIQYRADIDLLLGSIQT